VRGEAGDVRSDDAIVLRASLSDAARFEDIFDRHHDRIWRYLARLGGPTCADDLASEVFLVAFRRRTTFDPDRGSVSSWLYGIATNLARTRARSRARGDRAVARLQAQRTSGRSLEDDVAASDAARRAIDALDQLSAEHREVLVLAVWEELEYAAIAEVLGVEIGTVRSRLHRARAHLRELLEATGEVNGDVPHPRRPTVG
jgi:RNA polymerase sigma-70 factor (ECF subfamily)